jgi:hypothetical protein
MQIREHLDANRNNAIFSGSRMTRELQGPPELVSVLRPRRQPAWGRLTMAIYVNAKQVILGDGHARAARREEAWYGF